MKKIILTTIVAACVSYSAFSQGSVLLSTLPFANGGNVTTYGLNAINVNNATTWFTGTASWQVWYSTTATAPELNAINALNGQYAGGIGAYALLGGAGFSEVASGNGVGTSGTYVASTDASGTVDLPSPIPTAANEYLALVLIDNDSPIDSTTGYEGVLAFANNTGGNYLASPPGLAANLTGWDNLVNGTGGENLVLSPVPEPTTIALAGLGGLALLLIRRRS